MCLVALAAEIISAVIVMAYFIAIDQVRKTATAANGNFRSPAANPSLVKQLEALAKPLTSRMPAHETAPLRQQLSRAGDPGGLTPAGFQAVRYGLGALMAIAGLGLGVLISTPLPVVVIAPLSGVVAAFIGYLLPSLWLAPPSPTSRRQLHPP